MNEYIGTFYGFKAILDEDSYILIGYNGSSCWNCEKADPSKSITTQAEELAKEVYDYFNEPSNWPDEL